jgi:hypothetical protein
MTASVAVTERAAERIAQIVSNEPANIMLRVSVEGGGCSGFEYHFELGVHRQAGCAHRRIRTRSDRNPSPPTSHAGNATSTSLFATTATSAAILTTWQFLN